MIKTETNPRRSRIISACLELSDSCKVGCPYCLLEAKREETSKAHMLDIIKALDAYGVTRYTIGGGEPLEIPYIYEIGKFIKGLHHEVLLRTSGCYYIDCARVNESFDLVDISVDSYKAETMKICKPHIECQTVYNNIRNLSANRMNCRCNILITKYNYGDVIPTITWLSEAGIKDIRIQKLVKRGKAKAIYDDICVSEEQYQSLLNSIFQECSKQNINVCEVKSVNSQTLCIIKPNGELYIGQPTGLKRIGDVFSLDSLNRAAEMIYANQEIIYGTKRYVGISTT